MEIDQGRRVRMTLGDQWQANKAFSHIRIGTLSRTICFAATAMLTHAAQAHAQMSWPGALGGHYDRRPLFGQSWPSTNHTTPTKTHTSKPASIPKEIQKPQGPLLVTISTTKQRLKIYDANGLFAEAPVSTGTRSHPTPLGAFSVIQKNKWHRSNIYSDAPMPYMQRITWSGVALHAGILPGYAASHGCIRMPYNFAMRMWSWTKPGTRVIIAADELSPSDFSHPILITRKPAPVLVAANIEKATDAEKETGLPLSSDNIVTTGAIGPIKPRTGHVAIYLSRKDSKLYVRQNFEPLFDVPITIDSADRPLGTHIFTVRGDTSDTDTLHWSVISLASPIRVTAKRNDDEWSRHKKSSAKTEPLILQPPPTPYEALDRIAIPQDAMQRIASIIAPGSSLVISDQGLGNETGRGTDFIVTQRSQ